MLSLPQTTFLKIYTSAPKFPVYYAVLMALTTSCSGETGSGGVRAFTNRLGLGFAQRRGESSYLVPLELQACPIWCKIPQVRANDLSRGESEEDLEIGNLLSSCFLHDCEVDGDLGAVGGVPADGVGRGEHPPATRGTQVTPLVSSWLRFPP